MEYAEVVRRRRMVRNYDPDRPVPAEVVDRLLGYAVHAPSAGFSQGWGFLVLDRPADRERFWTATTPGDEVRESPWLAGLTRAPLIVVPHSNRDIYLDRYTERESAERQLVLQLQRVAARIPPAFFARADLERQLHLVPLANRSL